MSFVNKSGELAYCLLFFTLYSKDLILLNNGPYHFVLSVSLFDST